MEEKFLDLINKHCFYCERSFDNSTIKKTKDHIVPISKGGKILVNNIVYCCAKCNALKADLHPIDFIEALEQILNLKQSTICIIKQPNKHSILSNKRHFVLTILDNVKLAYERVKMSNEVPSISSKKEINGNNKSNIYYTHSGYNINYIINKTF